MEILDAKEQTLLTKNFYKEESISSDEIIDPTILTPADKLKFAGKVLMGVGFLFLIGIFAKIYYEDVEVFDACKTILPPIATLIIGYYFGESKS